MINNEDVIALKIDEYISNDEKIQLYTYATNFVLNNKHYYARQKGTTNEKIIKAYRWYISELIFQKFIYINNLNINNNIIFDWLSNNFTRKSDVCDVYINGLSIDIKSSYEKIKFKDADFHKHIDFFLNQRNYTLPVDQSNNKKDLIMQIMYNHENTYIYIIWYIYSNDLIKKWKIINLKVSWDWIQPTYMYKLKNWNPIYYLFNQ